MEVFLTDINTLAWWLGVVLVGVITGLVSSYLRSAFDYFFIRISKKYSIYLELAKNKEEALVSTLSGSIEQRIEFSEGETRYRLKAIANGLFAVGLIAFYIIFKISFTYRASVGMEWPLVYSIAKSIILYGSSMPSFLAIWYWGRADYFHDIVKKAKLRAAN